ncbi:MAG: transglycosylase SLT domain-containing protein [Alphaproteobacteria bacterium]|nr:transglycosylase SLT domain-containing protein [Alphaproteobacteria bacterium]MBV9372480.1 transglycosylase SLT domain-containing protein [Alphaproteobacteria bacterium]MBV9902155.1 transglycosylase SLT domain-containing protein [Alphaproteobacteria bacterium]
MLSLLGVSAGAVAAAGIHIPATHVARMLPAAVQSVVLPYAPPPAPPAPPAFNVPPAVSAALAQWNSLRQSDSNPFSAYASFLVAHRGWPGEAGLRKSAEKAIDPGSSSPAQVVSFFRALPPTTATGQARYAWALQASGRTGEAAEAARTAWTMGVLPPEDESRLLTAYPGILGPSDHDRRIDALLANGDRQSATRMLPLASAGQRGGFEARLALQTRAADAASRLAALPSGLEGDPGLLQDRANWLRNSGQAYAARQLLAQRPALSRPPANAETWLETLLTLAREAGNDRQWSTAYDIASKLDDAFPAGTDVSDRSYGERDAYTSLAWLAGSAALNRLGRPGDAVRMFERYATAARSQQTRSKGYYWAARAAHAAGNEAQSQDYLARAATAPDQFYGQLAIERLGRSVPPPPSTMIAEPGPAERAAFGQRSLVAAAKALGQMGRWTDQTLFVRAIAQAAETDSDRALAADFGRAIGRPDLGVWVAREARNKGATFYARGGFPEVPVAPVFSRYRTVSHAITRQESSFDRAAVSNAGARGMMQLMPGTARETAGKLGIGYDFGRLTSDPAYNMMLGTSYFSTLLEQWGGSMPLAIASYNAGAGNVRRWVAQNGDPRTPGVDMVRWIEDIPFFETRNYVQRVLENAVVYDTFGEGGGLGQNRLSFYLGKSGPG